LTLPKTLRLLCIATVLGSLSCTKPIPNRDPSGKTFPSVKGKSLAGEMWQLPKQIQGEKSILLVGYVQDAQFDIDRWLIGLEMSQVKTPIFEIPTIEGLMPHLISGRIDDGMRSGIPKQLWKAVITVYDDAEKILEFTGNTNPRNARVFLLDELGKVLYFHDKGFSTLHLRALLMGIPEGQKSACWSS